MLQKRRSENLRRTLWVEVLEDRTLLSGNVIAMRNPTTGLLAITGDSGDNAIDITEPVAGTFMVAGEAGTTVNGGPAQSFSSVSSINIQFLNGNDSVKIDFISIPGSISITAGTGNDTITLDDSHFQQADVTVGTEANGATGSNTVDVSNDTITGDHLSLILLNQSGLSGVRRDGSAGASPGSVNTVTMSSLTFTGGGNLNVTVDDGVSYFNAMTNMLTPASSVKMNNPFGFDTITTTGNVNVNLGDHFQIVDLRYIAAGNLTVAVENDVDMVTINPVAVQHDENINIGNVSTYPVGPGLLDPKVSVVGEVGPGASLPSRYPHGTFSILPGTPGALNLAVGSNANTTLPHGWPVEVTEKKMTGNLTISAGNGDAITVDPTNVKGLMDITMGNGGVNKDESLMVVACTFTDPQITLNSNAGDTVHINVMQVTVTNPSATLQLVDLGHGADIVNLMDVRAARLFVILSNSGHNVVTAKNVVVGFGFIIGGAGLGDKYIDNGGNSGYAVLGFP